MKQQRKEKMQVWKLFTERRTRGEFNILVKDLMLFDHFYLFQKSWIDPSRFAPTIIKCSKFRDVATPSERLCITFWYLVAGYAQATIASCDRVIPPIVSRTISDLLVLKSYLFSLINEFSMRLTSFKFSSPQF